MRFKVDENLPRDAAQLLVQAGYDACTVADQSLCGADDAVIAAVCNKENRVLVTVDRDFGDVRRYPPSQSAGTVIIRSAQQDKQSVLRLLTRLIPVLQSHPIEHHLWIVDDAGVRIRG